MEIAWRIHLFGHLSVAHGDQHVTRFRTHKAAALFAYLALQPGKAYTREHLTDLFWPDQAPAAARASLSNALTSLRSQFEKTQRVSKSLLLTDHQTVRLNPQTVRTDVQEFEACLQMASGAASPEEQRGLLEQAVACYRGELLTGFFEEWAGAEQSHLRERYLQALERLCQLLEQSGRLEAAIDVTSRLLEADSLEETHYQTRMRLALALGRPQEALQTYETLKSLLRSELAALPEPATQELADQALQTPTARKTVAPSLPPLQSQSGESAPAPASPEATLPARSRPPALFLPLQLTRFFGRESEMALLQQLLVSPTARLITLLGPGGAGKTRLAIEAARRCAPEFEGRVTFVPLTDLREASQIPLAIVRALHLNPSPETDPLAQALRALSAHPHLLILDNLEQMLDASASEAGSDQDRSDDVQKLVRTLLERAPELTCLLTSRQPLQVAGEQEVPIAPLPVPDIVTPDLSILRAYACVALYEDRVRLVKPDFAVTSTNEQFVAALCRRLEGLPLAMEMAGALGRTLSPQKTLERLEQRLNLSVTRRSDLPMRHQSLRATIEWSYDLLSPSLQTLFVALSVFRGGWTLEAVEEVCGEGLQEMLELAERSLVVSEEDAEGEARYRLLETLREFAMEKREERGETALLCERHAAYFLQMAEEIGLQSGTEEDIGRLARLEREHDNLRAALTWYRDRPQEAQKGLRLCGALADFWETRGHLIEGRNWCLAALEAAGAEERTLARARALSGAGRLVRFQKDYQVDRAYQEESLAIAREIGDQPQIAISLANLGTVFLRNRDYPTARKLLEEALALNHAMGKRFPEAVNLTNLGIISLREGNYPLARKLHEEALALTRAIGYRTCEAANLNGLGTVSSDEGDHATARRLHAEALALYRELGNRTAEAASLNNLGIDVLAEGDYQTARKLYEEALLLNRELGNRIWEAANLSNLAKISLQLGDYAAVRKLQEEALALNRTLGNREWQAINLEFLGKAHHHTADYAAAQTFYQEALLLRRDLGDRPRILPVLENIALLTASKTGLTAAYLRKPLPEQAAAVSPREAAGSSPHQDDMADLRQAAQLWGAVQALAAPPHASAQQKKVPNDNLQAVRELLGDPAMAEAVTAGRAFSLDQAIALALQKLT